ncbi:MAG: flippase [Chloroflexi bacterium]|nr:flippase [Chloroflexota bacterium]MBK7179717.1 flippase [Chloroflexota bacterium]MBK8933519.1 flippase [Chloroflexota bacterium]
MLFRVIKNFFFSFLSQGLLLLSSLGIYILVGRQMGPDGLGQFSFVMAYIGLFTFLPDLGLNLFLIREVSRDPGMVRYYMGYAFVLVLILSPISFVITVCLSQALKFDEIVRQSIYLGAGWVIVGAYLALFRASFHAYEKMEYETTMVLTERATAFVGSVLALVLGMGVVGLIGVQFLARLVALVVAGVVFVVKIDAFPRLTFNYDVSFRMLKKSLPFAVNALTTTIYIQLDLVLLGVWWGDEASGYYRAATSLIIPLVVIATSLNVAIFPNMARSFYISLDQTKYLLAVAIRYLFMIGWPLALGIALLSPAIIHFVYGAAFTPSVLALRILALIVPMRFVNNAMGSGLTAVNRQGVRSTIILISAGLNLLLNIILIPRFSFIGASYSTLGTEIVILISLLWSVSKYVGHLQMTGLISKVWFAGLLMAVVTYLLQDIHLLFVILISVVVYMAALWILKAIPSDDLARIKVIVSRRSMRSSLEA